MLGLGVSCKQSDWQLSSLAQVCGSWFPQSLISAVEYLYVREEANNRRLGWQDNIESSQWLELLHPFAVVKDLFICKNFTPRIAPILQELVGERATEVLPALQTLFLEGPLPSGPVQEAIEHFIAARQLSARPVSLSRWESKRNMWDWVNPFA